MLRNITDSSSTVSHDTKITTTKNRFWRNLVFIIAISLAIFHLYNAGFGSLLAIRFRAIHIGLIMVLVFLLKPTNNKQKMNQPSLVDVLLVLLTVFSVGYLMFYYEDIILRGGIANKIDVISGTIFLLLIVEAARRSVGWILPLLAIVFECMVNGYQGHLDIQIFHIDE